MQQLEKLTAKAIGTLVKRKDISPTEVIKYFASLIEKKNPEINAFVYTRIDEALEQAKELENKIMQGQDVGPFAGAPTALKDFLPSKKGWPATHGGVKSLQTIDAYDSEYCKAAEKLGAIVIGKTNAPSFGFRGTTDNKMYGPTSTPFRIGYNAGGSSGGSAAAVGSQMVPAAEVTDAGGSIRIPAAWCGVYGFKPSAGIIPSVCRPDAWTATHPYCCPGPATRSVEDAAIILTQMQGYDPRDPISVPIKYEDFTKRHSIKGMRIGYTDNFDLFPHCDSQISEAMGKVFDKLLDAGVKCIEPVKFDFHYSMKEIEEAWLLGISIDDSLTPEVIEAVDKHPEDMPLEFLKWHYRARSASMQDYRKFHEIRTDILDAHLDAFREYDIILTPVAGCLPVKNTDDFNTKGPKHINGTEINPLIGFGYTYLENMVGTPAASVPIGLSKEGFPIGMQIIANRYRDDLIFDLSYVLEEINPWQQFYDKV